jgi:N-acetylglutamate synthase-like GNAT family acetyltransferase/8-oxo-dGTP pyrophosphatase MutT (NUDIX family)
MLQGSQPALPADTVLRHDLKPGDLGRIVTLHGTIYATEYSFDPTFEAYVAGPLSEFVRSRTDRDRLWIAERDGQLVGCIAIVAAAEKEAQLRWFLVDPSARGAGLGKRLLHEALTFCQHRGYGSVFLWTVSALTAAARLYRSAGFEKVEEKPGERWGVQVIEEKYVLKLKASAIPEFGIHSPTADYVLRPGGYAVIFGAAGEVAVVSTPLGLTLPGGGQDAAEAPEEAAIRETREECGLLITLGERIGVADELVFAADEDTHYRKRCTFFLAQVAGTQGAMEADHELLWLTPEKAVAELLHESHRWAVSEACRLTQ